MVRFRARTAWWCLLLLFVPWCASAEFKLGIDVLGEDHPELVRGKKLALLVSGPSYDRRLEHVIDRLSRAATIEVIFTGEKYFRSTMPGASGTPRLDAMTSAPVYELLNPLKRPKAEQLGAAELLLIDIQDVGIRYQQYVTLLAQFLELARETRLPVILLDRPNPINGTVVSGPVLEVGKRSRFGVYPIPLVYGMTIGELALYFNKAFGIGAALTVVGMEGYSRRTLYRDTGLHWVPPSDHLPEPETPWVYAITGFLGEMGIFSTGVGTTRPFRYILAPWIDGELLAHRLSRRELPGVRFLPVNIQPYYGLYQNRRTPGIELVIDDPLDYDPVLTGVAILQALWELAPDRVPLKNPAVAAGLDTLLGSSKVREALIRGIPAREIQAGWQDDLKRFLRERQAFLLYPETPVRSDE